VAEQRLVFGGVADRYDRSRPDYPREAAEWLVGDEASRVLELGAGTGKLTETLVDLGHEVLATDPDERMLHRLRTRVPGAHVATGTSERIPAARRSVDVVVAAQAFHWFDLPRAVPEMARVLRPGGVLALVWNQRDEGIPWVRKLGALIGNQDQRDDPTADLRPFEQFGEVESRTFRHWQLLDREGVIDLVASRSNIASMEEDERAERLEQVGALYDDYGRGHDGMRVPYHTTCFRSVVADIPDPEPAPVTYAGEQTQPLNRADLPGRPPPGPSDGPDDGTLLIDFQ
jgi:SAM-dependent methyltransferase